MHIITATDRLFHLMGVMEHDIVIVDMCDQNTDTPYGLANERAPGASRDALGRHLL